MTVNIMTIAKGWVDYSKPTRRAQRMAKNPDGSWYCYDPVTETWDAKPQVDEDANWDYRNVKYWWLRTHAGPELHNTPGWHPMPWPKRKKKYGNAAWTPEDARLAKILGVIAIIAILLEIVKSI